MSSLREFRIKEALKARAKARKDAARTSIIPTHWAISNRSKLLAKENAAEERIEAVLKAAGILYNREHLVRCEGKDFSIDFVAETDEGLVAIEVDGAHHFTDQQRKRDKAREVKILRAGEVVRFVRLSWNEALGMNVATLRQALAPA